MNKQFKILVTDDTPEILTMSTMLLRRAGYEVLEASTGRDCIDVTRIHHINSGEGKLIYFRGLPKALRNATSSMGLRGVCLGVSSK